MSTFKEILKQDNSTLFNEDEFSSEHRIDGRSLSIIIDNDKLEQMKNKNFDGISTEEILYYVKADDFGELPTVDAPQKFDGRFMSVKSAIETDGMYEIILYQNRGE
ncbi:hypothetical protein D2A34_21875 [Clostridium chromiireducens]|uniref:Uncharacterized protein n=1 Tax=Clostridium chromiireducens TaxID=225345 RepID=A0A399IK32_9CLOT|nr:hypothetical protein [Clostridium chromiireducens]RII32847.1 hypothetical protein D2A34_21875 [Clostridium chromiireducens]